MPQTLHRHGALGQTGVRDEARHGRFPDGTITRRRFARTGLAERAEPAVLRLLAMEAQTEPARPCIRWPTTRLSLLRQTRQAAHLRIDLNGQPRLDELIRDGVMVATPAGLGTHTTSRRAGDPLPLGANVVALTPIAPFRRGVGVGRC